jgi:4-alpha-glucanotransferase
VAPLAPPLGRALLVARADATLILGQERRALHVNRWAGGGVAVRDAAYHQGPAWVWLFGHHAMAVYRVTGDAPEAQSLLEPVADHLADAGLGTVSELFDAEPPHTPRGAPAQAWSVACVLDAWCRLEQLGRTDKGDHHG